MTATCPLGSEPGTLIQIQGPSGGLYQVPARALPLSLSVPLALALVLSDSVPGARACRCVTRAKLLRAATSTDSGRGYARVWLAARPIR